MKIYVNRIPVEGIREEASYDPKTLDIDRFDIQWEAPVNVSSWITKAERELLVQADIRCPLQLSCARCLAVFPWRLETAATLNYAVQPTDVVDITEDIRQEILLAFPMVPVCRLGCQGLCAVCGLNLNISTCQHHKG